MHANQKTFVRDGVSIPLPVLNVQLNVAPDFTGRIVLRFDAGQLIDDRPLFDDERISTLKGFLDLAHEANWLVTAPPPSTD